MSQIFSYKKSFYAQLIYFFSFGKINTSTSIEYTKDSIYINNLGNSVTIKYKQIQKLSPEKKAFLILDRNEKIITEIKCLHPDSIDKIDKDIRYYYVNYCNDVKKQKEAEERIRQEKVQEEERLKRDRWIKKAQEEFYSKKENIFELYNKISSFLGQRKYISGSEAFEFSSVLRIQYENLRNLEEYSDGDILEKELYRKFNYISNINNNFDKELMQVRKNFLDDAFELEKKEKFFKSINEPYGLTEKQMLACFTNNDNNIVLAGAGSGKTLTMVARASYLIKNKLALPNEILILAYNTKAAIELRTRCAKIEYTESYSDNKHNITTFHSFGYKIVKEVEEGKFRKPINEAEQNNIYREVLENSIKDNHFFLENILNYCMYYTFPFPDKKKYGFRSIGEYSDFMKNYNIQSINPDDDFQFATYEECLIANFLFVNAINYEVIKYLGKQYFYIYEFDIHIIYEQDPYSNQNAMARFNIFERNFTNKNYVKISFTEIVVDNVESILNMKLGLKDIDLKVRSNEELFAKIRESKILGSFINLLKRFVSLYKNSDDLSKLTELKSKLFDDSFSLKRTKLFLEIFEEVFEKYEQALLERNKIDYDDMIYKAVSYVKEGLYVSPYKYIMIDEFQDISASRALLVTEILKTVENPNLFCVGDDWQAIYRFAGSDIKFISDFKDKFGSDYSFNCSETKLDYTFRFNNKILETSTNFVTQNEQQEKKEIKVITEVNEPKINIVHRNNEVDEKVVFSILTAIQKNSHNEDEITTVLILNRYGKYKNIGTKKETQKYFKEEINSKFKTLNVSYNTMHGSKGTEADYVILVDLKGGYFGFPTKKDNDELIEMMLPIKEEYPFAEERRLMYVALTRAKKEVWIESIQDKESDFVTELKTQKDKYEVREINFNKKEKGSLKIDDKIECPLCERGKIVSKYNSKTKTWYNACNNYPYCNYTLKNCLNEECNATSSLIRNDNNNYTCIACSKVFKVCTTCNDGVRTQCYIKQYDTTYINCSNVKFLQCKPKDNKLENHHDNKDIFFPKCKRNL